MNNFLFGFILLGAMFATGYYGGVLWVISIQLWIITLLVGDMISKMKLLIGGVALIESKTK